MVSNWNLFLIILWIVVSCVECSSNSKLPDPECVFFGNGAVGNNGEKVFYACVDGLKINLKCWEHHTYDIQSEQCVRQADKTGEGSKKEEARGLKISVDNTKTMDDDKNLNKHPDVSEKESKREEISKKISGDVGEEVTLKISGEVEEKKLDGTGEDLVSQGIQAIEEMSHIKFYICLVAGSGVFFLFTTCIRHCFNLGLSGIKRLLKREKKTETIEMRELEAEATPVPEVDIDEPVEPTPKSSSKSSSEEPEEEMDIDITDSKVVEEKEEDVAGPSEPTHHIVDNSG